MSTRTTSAFKLRRPCAKCPFRTDVPGYLRRARAREIAESLANGATFPCHETTVYDDEDETLVSGPDSQFCAGALIAMEREDAPNQMMRVAERIGVYDREKMDMDAPVVNSLAEFVRHHNIDGAPEPDDVECCCVVDHGCEAPAGFLVGGSVIEVDPEEMGELHDCPSCGEPVCDNCSDDEGVCARCSESET